MSEKIVLRDYQADAVKSFFEYAKTHQYPPTSPVMELPTGSGKSYVIAEICRILTEAGKRVLVLCRQKELVLQNSACMARLEPTVSVGVFCAGLGRKETDKDVTFATIQSVSKQACELGEVNLIIVDEAQHVPAKVASQYGSLLTEIKEYNPRCRYLGLTATPYRMSSGLIYGEGQVFDDCCYEVPVKSMLEKGMITKWVIPSVEEVDVSGVKIRGSDFDEGEMASEFIAKVESNAAEIIAASSDRHSVLCFATTINHAEKLRDVLGASTGAVTHLLTGKTSAPERAEILEKFKSGAIKYLVNCGVLTTGFDAPNVDVVALCRATQSAGLFYQILGRGMRLNPGKDDFLILDFGGNFDRLGDPQDLDFGRPPEAPKRVSCPKCDTVCLTDDVRCSECDHIFLTQECPICNEVQPLDNKVCTGTIPLAGSILSEECRFDLKAKRCKQKLGDDTCMAIVPPDAEVCPACAAEIKRREAGAFEAGCRTSSGTKNWAVTGVSYTRHTPRKENPIDSMRVTYQCERNTDSGLPERTRLSEWICIEHEGFARKKAVAWWKKRSRNECPESVYEAIELCTQGAVLESEVIISEVENGYETIMRSSLPYGTTRPLIDVEIEEEAPF